MIKLNKKNITLLLLAILLRPACARSESFDDYGMDQSMPEDMLSTADEIAEEISVEDIFDDGEFEESDDLFSVMTEIERKNALIKLKSEQEKLELSLAELVAKKESAKLDLEARTLKKKMEAQAAKREAEEAQRVIEEEDRVREAAIKAEERKQDMIDKLVNAIADDPDGDHTVLATIIKSENNGVLPSEISFLEGLLNKQEEAEVELAVAKTRAAVNKEGFIKEEKKESIKDFIEIESIMGIKGELIAVIRNTKTDRTSRVSINDSVDKYSVSNITSESIEFKKGSKIYNVYMGG